MKRSLLLLSYFCVFAFNDLLAQRHPFQDPQLSGERIQLFDGDWKFFLGDTAAAGAKDFNDERWQKLDLPHDWSI
jgi:hypothetical protein